MYPCFTVFLGWGKENLTLVNGGENFVLYTSKSYKVQEIKNTKYINNTAGGMLCHISPAAYTYKGSFTLYATPQKGREGHLNFPYSRIF